MEMVDKILVALFVVWNIFGFIGFMAYLATCSEQSYSERGELVLIAISGPVAWCIYLMGVGVGLLDKWLRNL